MITYNFFIKNDENIRMCSFLKLNLDLHSVVQMLNCKAYDLSLNFSINTKKVTRS